jgi:GntR family transcriptional regulator, galactonate operon transcriptional repressor
MRRSNLHHRVVDELGREIGAGLYPPGTPVPIEKELAGRFGVSRVVVREAVKVLAGKGMIVVRPRTGTKVQPRDAWNLFDPQVMTWRVSELAAQGGVGRKLVDDLMELRRIVEPPAVRLAAQRADATDISRIRAAFVGMQDSVAGRGDYVAADLAFHGAILTACHNQFLHQLRGALSQVLKTSFSMSHREPENRAASLKLHEEVLLGIERRDAAAAEDAVERLIVMAGKRLELVAASVDAA